MVVARSALELASGAGCEVGSTERDPPLPGPPGSCGTSPTSSGSQHYDHCVALWHYDPVPWLVGWARAWAFPVESCGGSASPTGPDTQQLCKYKQRGVGTEQELEPGNLGLTTDPTCEFPGELPALQACFAGCPRASFAQLLQALGPRAERRGVLACNIQIRLGALGAGQEGRSRKIAESGEEMRIQEGDKGSLAA